MCAMGVPMAGYLTKGKYAPVLDRYRALKSEKCVFFAVIFFYLTLFPCAGFIGAQVWFLKNAPGCFSFGVGF